MPFTTIIREEVKLELLKHKAMMNFYYDRGIAVVDDLGTKEAEELKGRGMYIQLKQLLWMFCPLPPSIAVESVSYACGPWFV